jgi:hypothetical protein
MRKLFLFAVLSCAIPMIGYSQFSINPKAGINYLWIGDSPTSFSNAGSEAGWQVGADLRMGRRLYFQPGFYLVRSGSQFDEFRDLTDFDKYKEGRASHLKVPINIGYKLINIPFFKLRINGGPVVNKFWKVTEHSQIPAESYQQWQYGANVGLGIDLLFMTLDANYEFGLTDYFVAQSNSKPALFSISAGFRIP